MTQNSDPSQTEGTEEHLNAQVDSMMSLLEQDPTGKGNDQSDQDDPNQIEEQEEDQIDPDSENEEEPEQEDSEDEDEDQEQDEESEEDLVEVKINGKTQQVTLDELKKGYSRESDYSRKTAELAEQRREVDQLKEQINQQRQSYQQGLQQLSQYAQQIDPVLADAAQTDWAKLAQEDPAEYTRKQAQVQQRQQQVQQLQQEQARIQSERQQEMLQQEQEKLLEKLPEWKQDQDLAKNEQADITEYLKGQGFTDEEVGSLLDHRTLMVARDAAKYRKQQNAKKTGTQKKVTRKSPSVKPKSGSRSSKKSQNSKNKQSLNKAKESNNPNDVVDAVLANLE